MATISPPLKWHGGKHYLAKQIVALMPPHLHYVEPYFGGGAVLLAHDPERDWLFAPAASSRRGGRPPSRLSGVSEVVNDIHGELVNFWRVLKDPDQFSAFRRAVEATPFCEAVFQEACRHEYDPDRPVESAFHFFIRCRQSLAGRMVGFTGVTKTRTRRRMNNEVSAWLTCVEGLPAVHQRLKRVLILNRPALNVIRKHDTPNTLFYCDPPYVHETRATTGEYAFEMTEEDHCELLDVLAQLKGKFLLSGYQCDLYDEAARRHGWGRKEFDLPNNASNARSKERKTECVWMNY